MTSPKIKTKQRNIEAWQSLRCGSLARRRGLDPLALKRERERETISILEELSVFFFFWRERKFLERLRERRWRQSRRWWWPTITVGHVWGSTSLVEP